MQPTVIIVGPTILDRDILTIDVTGLPHAAIECSELLAPGSGRAAVEESDNRHRLLRARRERPRRNRASNHFDEGAPSRAARSGAQEHANPIQSAAVAPSSCGVLLVIRGRWGCEEHAEICYRSDACGIHLKNIGCIGGVSCML